MIVKKQVDQWVTIVIDTALVTVQPESTWTPEEVVAMVKLLDHFTGPAAHRVARREDESILKEVS